MCYTSRGTSFSRVVRRKIFSIQSVGDDGLPIYKIVIKYLSVIVPVIVYTNNHSIAVRSIRIRCTTHEFVLFLALCDKAPDIWKSIKKVVRRRRATLISGTALADLYTNNEYRLSEILFTILLPNYAYD